MSHPRTPVQSNVSGFDEILSSGDMFMTPRNSLNSSNLNFSPHPLCKTTTIIKESSPSAPHMTKLTTTPPTHQKSSACICHKCGHCQSCETRRIRHSERQTPSNKQQNSGGPLPMSPDNPDQTHKPQAFQPKFLEETHKKIKMTKTEQTKWETVKTITETIIREKDMIIERQKLKRLQLEQQVRDLESKLRRTVLEQAALAQTSEEDQQLQIEEQAYKQLTNSAKTLADNSTLAKVLMEKSQLERQLGEAEHKIAELRCSILTTKSDLQSQIDYYKKQLSLRQDQEDAWRSRNDSMKDEASQASKELSRLKQYLADLPTQEEFSKLEKQVKESETQLEINEKHIEEIIAEKRQLHGQVNDLKAELRESNDQVGQLLSQISLLQKEISLWEDKEMVRSSTSGDDIIRLKENHRQLYNDYEKATKTLDAREERIASLTREYEERIQELSERLDHSESLIHAASEECSDRDEQIGQLKDTIKQVQQENHDCKERLLAWEEKIHTAEQVVSSETLRLEQDLVEDIIYCTNSLECLVEMCDNPRGLDMADMLATRPTPVTISSPREYVTLLEQQSGSLKTMNDKIEKLRQFILDKYADDMASNGHVDCAVQ